MKSYQNAGLEPYLYFCRDRDTKEIDVIMERDGQLFPLEVNPHTAGRVLPTRYSTNTSFREVECLSTVMH